jgi:hypothetical protein
VKQRKNQLKKEDDKMPHIKIEVTINLLATVDPERLMIDVANELE